MLAQDMVSVTISYPLVSCSQFQFICYLNLAEFLHFFPELLQALSRREKQEGIKPDLDIDVFMKVVISNS